MANNGVTLAVYTPITGTSVFVEDIAPYAVDYQHTIRLLGGYWTANFKLNAASLSPRLYDEWRTGRFFYHLVEQYQGQTTWEGSIEGIQPDDDKGILDITAYGYVHSIQNYYNGTTDTTTLVDANVWLETLRADNTQFIQSGDLQANTLQCYQAGTEKVWSEMLKVVELGDGVNTNPYQLGVYQDRRLYYKMVPTTPIGYVRGGIRWRVDGPQDVRNRCVVRYTNEAGVDQADEIYSVAESMTLYGRREDRLERSNLPTASATALARMFVHERMWPYMRAVGCGRDIQIYDGIGCNRAISPWMVQPGVYQDTTLIGAPGYYLSWMPAGCFLADEVVASNKGIQLRTSKWTELDALEAMYDYQADAPEVKVGKKKNRGRRNKGGGSTGGGGGGGSSDSGTTGTGGGGGGGSGHKPQKDLPT
jgi:uncharacterized membrane protein YgcG